MLSYRWMTRQSFKNFSVSTKNNMEAKEKELLEKFLAGRTLSDEDLTNNGFHDITPAHLIDTIVTAQGVLDYSNYDNANLDRILTYLLRYWKEHNIPLGPHCPEGLWDKIRPYTD